ncbi:MAG TPA: hypothetical protein VFS21_25460 [Roseiflexaceae bacterium]|nr:hypothetical protein [Roseiflexaceae bacterium]
MTTQAHITPTEHGSSDRSTGLWPRWTLATALGSAIGFATPVLVRVIHNNILGRFDDLAVSLVMLAVYLVVAALEGMALGLAQWLVLRQALPLVRWYQWIGATVLGTMAAVSLELLPILLREFVPLSFDTVSGALFISSMAALAAVGVLQWIVLRRYAERAWYWIFLSFGGQAFGMSLLFAALLNLPGFAQIWAPLHTYGRGGFFLNGDLGSLGLSLLVELMTRAVMGLLAGVVTGGTLVWLLRGTAKKYA